MPGATEDPDEEIFGCKLKYCQRDAKISTHMLVYGRADPEPWDCDSITDLFDQRSCSAEGGAGNPCCKSAMSLGRHPLPQYRYTTKAKAM